jgi:hypothetical protein
MQLQPSGIMCLSPGFFNRWLHSIHLRLFLLFLLSHY